MKINKNKDKKNWHAIVKKMKKGELFEDIVGNIPMAVKIKLNPKNLPMSTKQSKATRNG